MAIQGLWAGPWLADVGKFSQTEIAEFIKSMSNDRFKVKGATGNSYGQGPGWSSYLSKT